MEVKDLRIGNLVKRINAEAEATPVYKIGNNYVEFLIASDADGKQVHTQGSHLPGIKPIPLTYEWLLKFGLTSCESKMYDKPDILTIQISNNETLDYEDEEFFIAGISGHRVVDLWNSPKYVH